jgi:tetratricopeptide (TPR) repeat protein
MALFQALPRLGPRLCSLLTNCLNPFAGILIEWLWLGTTLSARQVGSIALIVTGVSLALSPGESQALARRPISDPRAHDSYLRARYEIWQFSRDGLDRARRHIANAESIVGENALLATTLGHIHIMYLEAGIDPDPSHLAEAAACAERAFRLDPESARAHWISGHVHFTRGEVSQALAAFERARRGAPDEPDMLLMLGYMYALVGRNQRLPASSAARGGPPLNHHGRFGCARGRQDALQPTAASMRWGPAVRSRSGATPGAGVERQADEADAIAAVAERFPGAVFTAPNLCWGFMADGEQSLRGISDRGGRPATEM